jgi:ferritin-like protein
MQKENKKAEENINVIGIKVLEQNGINIDEIIKLLVYNASVEFTAYYYFTNLRMHCTGQEGESIKGVIEDARLEDLSHFESCLSRIYELGEYCLSMHKSS